MVLPPLNIPPPQPGYLAPITIGPPQVPEGGLPTPPSAGGDPNDPSTIPGRVLIRNRVREGLMNEAIKALLAKQNTNQTLSSDEQRQLAEWEALVESEYSRQVGTAVPPDVQRILEQITKRNEQGSSSGGGRAGGGGGGASTRPSGGARSGASGGGAPASGGARPTGGVAPRPSAAATAAAARAAAGARPTIAAGTQNVTGQPTPLQLLRAIADRRAQREQQRGDVRATDAEYAQLKADVSDLLRSGGTVRPGNLRDVEANRALREVALTAWATQYNHDRNSVSPSEVEAFRAAGLIDPQGRAVWTKNGVGLVLSEAERNPDSPLNGFTRAWTGMTAKGENAPLSAMLRSELDGTAVPGAEPGAAFLARGGMAPPPTALAVPSGLDPASLLLHPVAQGERPIWVTPEGRVYGQEPNGQLTDMEVQPGAYQIAQQRNSQQAGRPDVVGPASAQAPITSERVLNDERLWGETGESMARAAWAAQRQRDAQTNQQTLTEADQVAPSREFLDTWKRWYAGARDAGSPPDLSPLLRADGSIADPTTGGPLPGGAEPPIVNLGPPTSYPETGTTPETGVPPMNGQVGQRQTIAGVPQMPEGGQDPNTFTDYDAFIQRDLTDPERMQWHQTGELPERFYEQPQQQEDPSAPGHVVDLDFDPRHELNAMGESDYDPRQLYAGVGGNLDFGDTSQAYQGAYPDPYRDQDQGSDLPGLNDLPSIGADPYDSGNQGNNQDPYDTGNGGGGGGGGESPYDSGDGGDNGDNGGDGGDGGDNGDNGDGGDNGDDGDGEDKKKKDDEGDDGGDDEGDDGGDDEGDDEEDS